jgi:hypothetical protein
MTVKYIVEGSRVQVVVKKPTVPIVVEKNPFTVVTMPVPGPRGPAGPSFEGTAWWYDEGPPGVILGAKPNDYYLDTTTGTVYKLGD